MTERKLGNTTPTQPSVIRASSAPVVVCMARSGAGKTTLLETLNDSEYGPVCVLDIDRKAHVLTDRTDRDVYPISTWKELDDKVQELLKQRLHSQYNTVCFDGTTAIQQILSYNKHSVRETTNPQLRQSAYGNSNLDLVDLAQSARLLAEAGIHVIFNIWAMYEADEDTKVVRITPDLSPTLLNRMLGLFDYVVYLEPNSPPAKPYPPIMYWGGSPTRATRTAVSPDSPLYNMPEKIYNPSWVSIFDSYHGKPWPATKHQKG